MITNLVGIKNPIVLATEPYFLKTNKLPKVHKDLIPYYYDKGDSSPRAAALVHKSVANRCWELAQFTTADQVVLRIKHNKEDLILVTIYMDGNKQVPPPELTPVVEYAKKHDLPLLIGSDTNAQHVLWGNGSNNNRGNHCWTT